jgi:hypothetical protein
MHGGMEARKERGWRTGWGGLEAGNNNGFPFSENTDFVPIRNLLSPLYSFT